MGKKKRVSRFRGNDGTCFLLALGLLAAPVSAQTIATSPAPDQVGVTVYRSPFREAGERLNVGWLKGFALISETRRISIPAGEANIRFEGVADGILPQSAIITGFPGGVVEKNHDAYLLSPGSLIDASLGKRVHLRRTSRATGAVRELEAVVRSSAQGGVVLETEAGIEALRCTGLPETVTYDRVPPGLSAKPTLSVRVRSARAVEATVTLSYLTTGFDWQANYVAELSSDGKHMDLFAWLTLGNDNETGFRNAETNAVAGNLNNVFRNRMPATAKSLRIQCWPSNTTSNIPRSSEDIVVTGARIAMQLGAPPPPPPPPPPPNPIFMMAEQEELGDLKLYRIPEPVTVAAKSQKQVALLDRSGVKVDSIYRQRLYAGGTAVGPVMRVITTRNRKEDGLGLPLPAGGVVLFAQGRERPVLIGRGSIADNSIGEDVEIEVGAATAVTAELTSGTPPPAQGPVRAVGGLSAQRELTIANANPYPVRYEAEIEAGGGRFVPSAPLTRRDGRPLWAVIVPANGRATLRYTFNPQ